ncbi:MAG: hypothetical protein EA351_02765 [Gemmatimonadales bacterium]|nr:MAG: hypothetical protein EA351_02765 [Gemmatimonadales bacterium]
MTMDPSPHLESDVLQALAEGELSRERERLARAHLDECARCRSEMQGWALLFSELEELQDLRPSSDFSARVMSGVEVEASTPARSRWIDRLLERVPGVRPSPGDRHLSVQGIQDYLEGALDRGTRSRVESHLDDCLTCGTLRMEWEALFSELDELPQLAPATGFADQVMAKVPVAAIAKVANAPERSWVSRATELSRRLLPSSPKSWAVAGGVFMAPSVGLIAGVAAVVVHPLLSLRELALFIGWRASDLGSLVWAYSLDALTGAPGVYWLMDTLRTLFETPGLAAAGIMALWALTMTSAWVLYRYIVAPTLSTGHHAKLS